MGENKSYQPPQNPGMDDAGAVIQDFTNQIAAQAVAIKFWRRRALAAEEQIKALEAKLAAGAAKGAKRPKAKGK